MRIKSTTCEKWWASRKQKIDVSVSFFSRALAEFFENGKICGQAAYVFNLQQRQTPSFFILSPDCPQEFRSIPR